MELCQYGDIENFMKKHPSKMLDVDDCRNLLFQMAFALVVAGGLSVRHYDIKLLNFFLASAKDPSIEDEVHPSVVLSYHVGKSVFCLQMDPSRAYVAKLADFGTSTMDGSKDGQPITSDQFTTLENTPPDFLILGNDARQGFGHDCFGLGLCMLHLFTGHHPYEEILSEVKCPSALKRQLKAIWQQKKPHGHDVIQHEIENQEKRHRGLLYDTLYRFFVLFGVPDNQFGTKEEHKKMWQVINNTLCSEGQTAKVFKKDSHEYSLAYGNNKIIADARSRLRVSVD